MWLWRWNCEGGWTDKKEVCMSLPSQCLYVDLSVSSLITVTNTQSIGLSANRWPLTTPLTLSPWSKVTTGVGVIVYVSNVEGSYSQNKQGNSKHVVPHEWCSMNECPLGQSVSFCKTSMARHIIHTRFYFRDSVVWGIACDLRMDLRKQIDNFSVGNNIIIIFQYIYLWNQWHVPAIMVS